MRERLHGIDVHDPHRWLEDGDDPDVRSWVERHNAATRAALDARTDRPEWVVRLTDLTARAVVHAAQVRAGSVVLLERPEGADQARLVRGAREGVVVLADPAATTGDPTAAIDWFHLSPNGALVAYGVSEGGTEQSVLRVARTADGTHLDEAIPDTRACSLAWDPDAGGFAYTRYPPGEHYHRTVHHHRLGTPWRTDPVVWAEHPTPETWPTVAADATGRWLVVTAMADWSRDDVHLLDRTTGRWFDVARGLDGRTTLTPTPDGTALVGVTTVGSPFGRVVRIPLTVAGPGAWETVVPERDGGHDGAEPAVVVGGAWPVADGGLLVLGTRRATDVLEWWRWDPGDQAAGEPRSRPVTVDLGPVSVDAVGVDPVTADVVAVRSGFTAPGAASAVGRDGSTEALWPDPSRGARSPSGDDPTVDDLTVEELTFDSTDGATVGMFVVRGAAADGPAPTILTGYGGFGITMSPAWSPLAAAWCAAGGVYAVVGLRGGSEHGEAWHRAGKRARKQQVFDDFAAAADFLVASGRTTRGQLAVAGGSNGGLLVGATVTQRPDVCRAAWCAVPLLDMVRFPRFLIARLWTEEYGDPDVAEEFAWLHAYSPYHNVVDGTCYPAVLLTTAEGDTRVDPMHARKMAARLTEATSCGEERPVLLHQAPRAGHGQGKPAGARVQEHADVLTFLAWQLGAPTPTGDRSGGDSAGGGS